MRPTSRSAWASHASTTPSGVTDPSYIAGALPALGRGIPSVSHFISEGPLWRAPYFASGLATLHTLFTAGARTNVHVETGATLLAGGTRQHLKRVSSVLWNVNGIHDA